jgi:L-2-hydroxyglutarate oxidase LhgO
MSQQQFCRNVSDKVKVYDFIRHITYAYGSRDMSDIPPRYPRFTQNDLAMRNTADVPG